MTNFKVIDKVVRIFDLQAFLKRALNSWHFKYVSTTLSNDFEFVLHTRQSLQHNLLETNRIIDFK